MKNILKDFFDVKKYKRMVNTTKNKYENRQRCYTSLLEEVKDKDDIIIRLQEKIIQQKEDLLSYKEKEIEKLNKKLEKRK